MKAHPTTPHMPVLVAAAMFLLAGAAGAGTAAKPAAPGAPLKVSTMTMVIGHRAFPEFHDRVTVKLHETFRVGDTEYSAKVVEFQPDFAMDLKTRKVISRSAAPNNPAAKVYVWKNGAPDDTSWAFLNMPPHFGRHSMLAFQLSRIEFENHAPVESRRDSIAAAAKAGGVKP
jgi:hypothetical protein